MKQWLGLFILSLLFTSSVQAHHPSSSSSSTGGAWMSGRFSALGRVNGKQKPNVSVIGQYDRIDETGGHFLSQNFFVTVPFASRFAASANLPIIEFDAGNGDYRFGFGDVELGASWVFLKQKESQALLGLNFSFPTGSESKGLSYGAVSQEPFLLWIQSIKDWQLSGYAGHRLIDDSALENILTAQVSLRTPQLKNRFSVEAFLLNQNLFASPVLDSGSGKVFLGLQTQINLDSHNKWSTQVGAKVSVYDYLSARSGANLSNNHPVLRSDHLFSVWFGVSYQF